MKKTLLTTILAAAALAAAPEAAADEKSGTGWTLTDDGVLTVTKEYEWNDEENDDWKKNETSVLIKKITIEKGVSRIGDGAFSYLDSLTEVSLPEGITRIGRNAFSNCKNLKGITIPAEVTEIGAYAFYNCINLTELTIPQNVGKIYDWAFHNCRKLEAVVCESATPAYIKGGALPYNVCALYVPEGAATAYKASKWGSAFLMITEGEVGTAKPATSGKGWELAGKTLTISSNDAWESKILGDQFPWLYLRMDSVVITDGVTDIDNNAFKDCIEIESVKIAKSVKSLGNSSFSGCKKMRCVNIPDGVTKIGYQTFLLCESLTNIELPQSISIIDEWSFCGCNLKSINIPDGVTSIGESAFYSCRNLANVTIPKSVTEIGDNAFQACESLENIEFPDGVSRIGDLEFAWCVSLRRIALPESIASIGIWAFRDCAALTSVTIPKNVTRIDEMAFSGCKSLTSVISMASTAPELTGDNVFNKDASPLYVPDEAVEAYKASAWADYFSDIRPLSGLAASAADVEAARPAVRVRGGMIEADGEHAVYNLGGQRMPNGRKLPAGVYAVNTQSGAVKVVVR